MNPLTGAARALLELAYPERCGLCGAGAQDAELRPRGPRAPGLRPWDRSHLCEACLAGLVGGKAPREEVAADGPTVWAAASTGPGLVRVVGLMKYHGVRGLAWPLSEMLTRALRAVGRHAVLVPVPLHRRKRRERGFNQAELLARLASRALGWPLATDLLVRSRATAQQARIREIAARRANLHGAFGALPVRDDRPLLLVDDLVTTGATAAAAAAALEEAGWRVLGAATLGMAAAREGGPGPVDTAGRPI